MSTEQKPASSDQTALAAGLATGWEKFKRGELIRYHWMALILVVVAGIGVTWWILHERSKGDSAKWKEWDGLTATSDLEQFVKDNPDTVQARLAKLELARAQLGADGIDKMGATAPGDLTGAQTAALRKMAVENVEKARQSFTALVEEFKNDPTLKAECLYCLAKAEAALLGVPKEGQLDQFRGDPNKLLEWLDKLVEAAPDTKWAEDAKKLATALRNTNPNDVNSRDEILKLQGSVFSIPKPTLPTFDPKAPDPKLGPLPGLPGGGK